MIALYETATGRIVATYPDATTMTAPVPAGCAWVKGSKALGEKPRVIDTVKVSAQEVIGEADVEEKCPELLTIQLTPPKGRQPLGSTVDVTVAVLSKTPWDGSVDVEIRFGDKPIQTEKVVVTKSTGSIRVVVPSELPLDKGEESRRPECLMVLANGEGLASTMWPISLLLTPEDLEP